MRESVRVAVERIKGCVTWTEVLRLCFDVSGHSLGRVAWDCGWRDNGRVLSRILRQCEGDDQRYMPHDKLVPFMVACGNAAPLWWLMLQLEMRPEDAPHFEAESGFSVQFMKEQRSCQRLLVEILAVVKSADRAAVEVEASFCLVERDVLPEWLMLDAYEVARAYAGLMVTRQ